MSHRKAKRDRGPRIRPYLGAAWAAFRGSYLPPVMTEKQIIAARNTFMAGAATSLRMLRDALEEDIAGGHQGESKLIAEVNRQTIELNDYQDAANLAGGIRTVLRNGGRRD